MARKLFFVTAAIFTIILGRHSVYASYPNTNTATINVGGNPTSCALAGDYLFVANSSDDTVSAINLADNSVKTINVGNNPQHVVATNNGSSVYVSNTDDDNISIISTSSFSVTSTISNVGDAPAGMCVSPTGSKLYVACKGSDAIAVISTSSNLKERDITAVGDAPVSAVTSTSGNYLYVALESENSVASINLATYEVSSSKITVGTSPQGIAITPDGNSLYVANSQSDSVSIISTLNSSVTKTISNAGDGAMGIAILPNGEYAFVANSNSNNATVINMADNTVTATLSAGSNPFGIAVSSDNKKVYVANKGSGTVSIFQDQAVILIDKVDNPRVNNSGTAHISWHTTTSGAYQIEVGGSGTKGSGSVISTGDVAAYNQNEANIVAATHLLNGDGAYKIYFYFTSEDDHEYSNFTTIILDNVAPAVPAGVKVTLGDMRLYLSWDKSNEIDLKGHKVYYGTASGVYTNSVETGLENSYALEGLTNGVLYYIAIATVDLAGNESGLSSEVSEAPDKVLSLSNLKGESGCFVATAAYQVEKRGFASDVENIVKRFLKILNLNGK